MPGRAIIVVGASAGGVGALKVLVGGLPVGLPAAVFVVCHFPPEHDSHLPELLNLWGPLRARHPRDGEAIRPGRIYVAPPDYHLVLRPGRVELSRGPRENNLRPAIDPLFRSAARAYGPRVAGVILSGSVHGGVAGLLGVRAAGGAALVQDPREAVVSVMPRAALDMAGADEVLPTARLAARLAELAGQPPERGGEAVSDPLEAMPQRVTDDMVEQVNG